MSRKFVLDRSIAFIHAINRELIQHVIGEEVRYYAIDLEQNRPHRVYGESAQKVWRPPVRIDGLISYDNPEVASTKVGPDARYRLEVHFHRVELQERNVEPREGDFIEFGQIFYEITSVTYPQLIHGQQNNRIMAKCVCIQSREGQFQAGGRSSDAVDHSHPTENGKYEPR